MEKPLYTKTQLVALFAYGHQIGMNTILAIQSKDGPNPIKEPDSDNLRDEFIATFEIDSFEAFKTKWENDILPYKPFFIRKGQSLMNYLGDVWIDEYKRISSDYHYDDTSIDCFSNDDLIPNTLRHLKKVWVNK
jgi:hypothetical protein|tara:strand:- start:1145 stop:1546 length:402 start_codon:yes stop_codon:yes gene_type:complete